jgi:hypothetical protein
MTKERLIREAETQFTLARKIHKRASETGDAALEKAYRRAMLYDMEKAVAAERVAPDYVSRLRGECLEKMGFLERKMELMAKVWREGLYEQYAEALARYELTYDQAVALGWKAPRPELPEGRYASSRVKVVTR